MVISRCECGATPRRDDFMVVCSLWFTRLVTKLPDCSPVLLTMFTPASPSTVCCKLSTCVPRLVLDKPLLAAVGVAMGTPVIGVRWRGQYRALVDDSHAGVA